MSTASETAADWFTLPPQERTKERLLELLRWSPVGRLMVKKWFKLPARARTKARLLGMLET